MESLILKQGQVQLLIMTFYLSAIQSWYNDYKYSLNSFKTLRIKLFLQGGKLLFPTIKAIHLPTIKEILFTIIVTPSMTINNFNIETVFKVV